MKTTVDVFGTPCEVSTDWLSKSVCRATGRYLGERFEGKGRTESAAVSAWREAAKYYGNDPPRKR
jgi:hypothetical protein